ncbi:hypothetical protein ACFQH6_19355 [Halobacteriaceae archaeon GCM10025711]
MTDDVREALASLQVTEDCRLFFDEMDGDLVIRCFSHGETWPV